MEEYSTICDEKLDIQIGRKVYNERCLTETNGDSSSGELAKRKSPFSKVFHKIASCSCSWNGFLSRLVCLAPIIRWLPKYSVKKDLSADITGGVTVGIMHIPQGNLFDKKKISDRLII